MDDLTDRDPIKVPEQNVSMNHLYFQTVKCCSNFLQHWSLVIRLLYSRIYFYVPETANSCSVGSIQNLYSRRACRECASDVKILNHG